MNTVYSFADSTQKSHTRDMHLCFQCFFLYSHITLETFLKEKMKYSKVKNDVSILFWENWLFARCWFMVFDGVASNV